jgi:LPXTG-motif cell wall-anchored protein
VKAFRLVALAYALCALLIAPSWLAAQEEVAPAPQPAVAEDPAPSVEPAPQPAEPVTEEEPAEQPAAVAQQAQEPAAEDARPAPQPRARPKSTGEPVAKAAANGSVTITDFEFTPATITVDEGDTVTWVNKGPTLHTATAEDGSFDTGNLDKGESGSATFTSAGTIPYICTPHPFMKGKVVVRAAAAGDDGAGDGAGGSDDSGAGTAGDATDAAADDEDDTAGLPATGFETAVIALLGLATLGAGLVLRRRAT